MVFRQCKPTLARYIKATDPLKIKKFDLFYCTPTTTPYATSSMFLPFKTHTYVLDTDSQNICFNIQVVFLSEKEN